MKSCRCSWGLKLWLLLYKNLLLRWRLCYCFFTFAEILFPTAASIGLGIIFKEVLNLKSSVIIAEKYNAPIFELKYTLKVVVKSRALFGFITKKDIEVQTTKGSLLNPFMFAGLRDRSPPFIAYYPDTFDARTIASLVKTDIGRLSEGRSSATLIKRLLDDDGIKSVGTIPVQWKPFVSEADIEAEALQKKNSKIGAAIIFNKDDLRKKGKRTVRYKIRLKLPKPPTTSLAPAFPGPGPGKNVEIEKGQMGTWGDFYCKSGFVGLMVAVDKAVLKWASSSVPSFVDGDYYYTQPVDLKAQGFPYPKYKQPTKNFVDAYILFIPKLLMIGFICIGVAIITGVISEKETGIKELMKMTGVPNWMHLIAYFINSLWVQLFGVTVFAIVLTYPFFGSQFAAFERTSTGVVWIVLFLYVFASTAFCFFITSFFSSKASVVLSFEIIVWLFTYFGPELFLITHENYDYLTFGEKMAFCLLPNVGMLMSIRLIAAWEGRLLGVNFKTFSMYLSKSDGISLFHICLMFIFDILFYTLFAVYLENVLPSPFGIRKPFYYIFQWDLSWCCFWKQKSNVFKVTTTLPNEVNDPAPDSSSPETVPVPEVEHFSLIKNQEPAKLEDVPQVLEVSQSICIPSHHSTGTHTGFEIVFENRQVGIKIRHLRKVFGKKVSVQDLNTDIFKGETTVILGHNGAGKSTTISILTGLFSQTSGTAEIYGYDINKDMVKIREFLGLCPQNDVLFPSLTTTENLHLFGRFRGLTKQEAKVEIISLLNLLQLTPKANVEARRLSGGQKRKLCLLNSLIGNTKVVILDEPTSGMDIQARRAVWDVLLALRGQRTIILVTHYMEEADILGDRILVMANGNLMCSGSPTFLKRFYGSGYTLKLGITASCDKEKILSIVQQFVPSSTWKDQLKSNETEVDVQIPSEPSPNAQFPVMFSKLQTSQDALGITSIGLSATTLDEVFLRVGQLAGHGIEDDDLQIPLEQPKLKIPSKSVNSAEIAEEKSILEEIHSQPSAVVNPQNNGQVTPKLVIEREGYVSDNPDLEAHEEKSVPVEISYECFKGSDKLSKSSLWMMRFWGLFVKRVLCSFRRRLLTGCQMLIPVAVVCAAILLTNFVLSPKDPPPPLTLSLGSYDDPVALYAGDSKYVESYRTSARGAQIRSLYLPSVQEYLETAVQNLKEKDLTHYREKYIIGTTMEKDEIVGMFNTIMYHAAPLSLNIVANSIAQSIIGIARLTEVTTHPLVSDPLSLLPAADDGRLQLLAVAAALAFALFLPIGFGLLAGTFVILPIEEKLCKGKQLQLMTGVSPVTCFLAALLYDAILMTLVILVVLCFFPILENFSLFSDNGGLYILFLILWIFGITAILFSYLYTTIAHSVIGGILTVSLFHTIPGLVFTLGVVILEEVSAIVEDNLHIKYYAYVLRVIGRFFPAFGITISAVRLTETLVLNSSCKIVIQTAKDVLCSETYLAFSPKKRVCCDSCGKVGGCFKPMELFKWYHQPSVLRHEVNPKFPIIDGIPQELLYVVSLGVLYLALFFCIEYRIFSVIQGKLYTKVSVLPALATVDDDVLEEQNRVKDIVSQNKINEEAFVVDGLIKSYGHFIAVKRLSFAVHFGDCFGLLGVNGAGKTTTFRMLTGDEIKSGGNAYIGIHSLDRNPLKFFGGVGYTPQVDAIIPVLSGKEMLTLFARLRGVRHPFEEADMWLKKTGLSESANVQCGKYSGGMKRRLSTAMALIAQPPIVLLDEPSSGVDPVSQKMFWKIIAAVKQTGQAVVLTSHSLEECETLCGRLGIMVNGQFQCLGGPQHLKSKYATGYCITVSLFSDVKEDSDNVNAFNNQVLDRFQPVILEDRHQNLLQYHVNNTAISWAFLFENMELLKTEFKEVIEDYVVSEASLEEVFLSFARNQGFDS